MYPFGDFIKNTRGYTAIEYAKINPLEPCVNVSQS